jgi:hypothetical protein
MWHAPMSRGRTCGIRKFIVGLISIDLAFVGYYAMIRSSVQVQVSRRSIQVVPFLQWSINWITVSVATSKKCLSADLLASAILKRE